LYLEGAQPWQRGEFERIRAIVRRLVPVVEETISYGMPTFTKDGRYILYVGAFKAHMSIFPGTIKFTEKRPLTEQAIEEIVGDLVARHAAR
jgi:uncharacterized protein YdhG (YjbR/CyaY superfamily)